jgi:hypothetical protein
MLYFATELLHMMVKGASSNTFQIYTKIKLYTKMLRETSSSFGYIRTSKFTVPSIYSSIIAMFGQNKNCFDNSDSIDKFINQSKN